MIEWRNISKWFVKSGTTVQVLDDLSLTVQAGEFLTIVGPSGCGKSTLLNITAGLMHPNKGQVYYAGEPVTEVNTRVGYITQKDNLLPWRTVRGNVALALEVKDYPGKERQELVGLYIQMVGLNGFENHYPSELSGGMRKRTTLARTLIYDPETLLMDEPFGALDAQLKLMLQDELLELWRKTKKTIVFVTHDLAEAVSLADRVVVMSARPGQVKLIQDIDLPRPRDVYRVRFSTRFSALCEQLWSSLREDFSRGAEV